MRLWPFSRGILKNSHVPPPPKILGGEGHNTTKGVTTTPKGVTTLPRGSQHCRGSQHNRGFTTQPKGSLHNRRGVTTLPGSKHYRGSHNTTEGVTTLPRGVTALPRVKTLPRGLQHYPYLTKHFFPPSFLFARACFACIYEEARSAVYQIRKIPITGEKPPKNFRQDKVI